MATAEQCKLQGVRAYGAVLRYMVTQPLDWVSKLGGFEATLPLQ